MQIKLVPNAGMQTKALESPADELFLGGQAGPGKSWFLLYADVIDAIKYPTLRVLFLRRKTPELADLLDKAVAMYTPLGARYLTQHPTYRRSVFVFPEFEWKEDEDGNLYDIKIKEGQDRKPSGAMFVFGHMDEEKTKYDYGGFEFQRINWDELPNFMESQYLFMWSRLRSANGIRTRMRGSGNPVGVGMLWVKRRFIDPMPPESLRAFSRVGNRDIMVPVGTPGSRTRMFIPGDRKDNLALDTAYESNLAMLDRRAYEALALGRWQVEDLPGQLISAAWIDFAVSGKVEPIKDEILRKLPSVAFDYATDRGVDKSVLMAGRGNVPMDLRSWPYTRQGDAAYLVTQAVAKWGSTTCKVAIDANGPGTGLAEMLEDGRKDIELKLPEFHGRIVDIPILKDLERCVEVDRTFSDRWKMLGQKNFPNFRSQMYWKLKDDMEHGRLDLSYLANNAEASGNTVDWEELQKELLSITYEERNGLIYVVSKTELRHADRLGRSPDYADTLAMWNWVRDRTRTERAPRMPGDEDDRDDDDVGALSARMLA